MTDAAAPVFEGRASGKVILFGEHAVVYGVPGIAAGIERGARATVSAREGGASTLLLGGETHEAKLDGDDLGRALLALLSEAPAAPGSYAVEATADVPPGGGLGCSAALGVAIARALGASLGSEADAAVDASTVLARATAWEKIFHGNPSGIDTAAAMAGGCLKFERGVGATPLSAPVDLWLAVGYSGTSASTKEMVEGVARTRERLPELANKFLEGVRALVENAELAVTSGDAEGLGRLMDLNQMLLAGMMLSTDQIEHMCRSARASGALGAKLTGSGGGGSVIALAGACPRGERTSEPERLADAVVAAWGEEGFTGFATRISGRGAGARDVRAFDGSAQEMDT